MSQFCFVVKLKSNYYCTSTKWGRMSVVLLVIVFSSLMTKIKTHRSRDRELNILDGSLYKGDEIEEFLKLCHYPNNPDMKPEDFESYYKYTMSDSPTEPRCPSLDVGIHDGMSSEDEKEHVQRRFQDLRHAQQVVRTYHHVLVTPDFYALLGILLFIIAGGTYLVILGHYDSRALLDEYHPDGSNGIPCWQYLRMRYVAAKVRSTTQNKTLLVPMFEKGVELKETTPKPKHGI